MYCPKCGYEYRESFTTCSDCGVELEGSPPSEESVPMHEDYEFVRNIFSQHEQAIIKSILDAEEISYYLQGEHFNTLYGSGVPVRLMVMGGDVPKAKDLLMELDRSFSDDGHDDAEDADGQ